MPQPPRPPTVIPACAGIHGHALAIRLVDLPQAPCPQPSFPRRGNHGHTLASRLFGPPQAPAPQAPFPRKRESTATPLAIRLFGPPQAPAPQAPFPRKRESMATPLPSEWLAYHKPMPPTVIPAQGGIHGHALAIRLVGPPQAPCPQASFPRRGESMATPLPSDWLAHHKSLNCESRGPAL